MRQTDETVKRRELLSPKDFGAALGVSRQAVMEAIGNGRLEGSVTKDHRGRWKIDLVSGRDAWKESADPAKRPRPGARKPTGRPPTPDATPELPGIAPPVSLDEEEVSHARASTARVLVDTEKRRLELEQLKGNLIDRAEAQREQMLLARLVRDRLQAIPDRIAAQLAALSSPAQCHELLTREIADALDALARDRDALPELADEDAAA